MLELNIAAFEAGSAEGTKKLAGSHLHYWKDFCKVMRIDSSRFGTVGRGDGRASHYQVNM